MNLTFAEPTLEALDGLRADCLVLTAFSDDRPLRGLAGRVDWRLCGQLSEQMLRDFVDLGAGRALLMPQAGQRLPFRLLLLVGMGRRAEYDGQRFDGVCQAIFRHLAGLGLDNVAMALPGRVGLDVALRGAVQGLARAIAATTPAASVLRLRLTLLEPIEVQRELADPLRDVARRLDAHAREALGDDAPPEAPAGPGDGSLPAGTAAAGAGGHDDAPLRDWRRGLVRLPPAEAGGGGLSGDL